MEAGIANIELLILGIRKKNPSSKPPLQKSNFTKPKRVRIGNFNFTFSYLLLLLLLLSGRQLSLLWSLFNADCKCDVMNMNTTGESMTQLTIDTFGGQTLLHTFTRHRKWIENLPSGNKHAPQAAINFRGWNFLFPFFMQKVKGFDVDAQGDASWCGRNALRLECNWKCNWKCDLGSGFLGVLVLLSCCCPLLVNHRHLEIGFEWEGIVGWRMNRRIKQEFFIYW